MSKHIFYILSALLVLFLSFISCSKDDDAVIQNNAVDNAYISKSISLDMLDDYLKSLTSGSIVEIKLTDDIIDFDKLSHCLYGNKTVKVKLDLRECSATKEIPENAFCVKALSKSAKIGGDEGVTNLISVVLPESVDVIGASAFKNCAGLKEISLPQSLTEIGQSGFSNCTSLSSIVISDGITQLKGYSFENCSNLQTVVIPSSVYEIDYYAFDNCNRLVNITNNSYSDFPKNNRNNYGSYKSKQLIKTNTITRVENNAITCCNIHDDYFQFDFYDGALFQISLEGEIIFTSECVPLDKFSDTYGVCIRNFAKTDTAIVFELADGEYSTNFAHYIVNFNQDVDPEFIDNYSYDRGIYQNDKSKKTVMITRVENENTHPCMIFDDYFEFDFNDGAQFQISFDGKIIYTSECIPINEYINTYGVCIRNFAKTDTTIVFELADGEYASDFAHYIVNLNKIVDYYDDYNDSYFETDHGTYQNGSKIKTVSITRTDNSIDHYCYIYDTFFEFDFDDGAQFQISFDGVVLYTSEGIPLSQYKDSYGVFIKNFVKSESTITFDLADGEYSSNFAHYVIDLTQIIESDDIYNGYYNDINHGTYQNGELVKNVTITRTDNSAVHDCYVYTTYFEFDFDDGAQFQISLDGVVLYTSECVPLSQYEDSYGVSIRNFVKTASSISFDLIDGEYAADYAHYVVKL